MVRVRLGLASTPPSPYPIALNLTLALTLALTLRLALTPTPKEANPNPSPSPNPNQLKWPRKPRSIKPVLVERGPGFNGEVSFIDRQAIGEPGRAAKVRAIADQLVWEVASPGSVTARQLGSLASSGGSTESRVALRPEHEHSSPHSDLRKGLCVVPHRQRWDPPNSLSVFALPSPPGGRHVHAGQPLRRLGHGPA